MADQGTDQPCPAASFDAGSYLGRAMSSLPWSPSDLWMGGLTMGGYLSLDDVEAVLAGRRQLNGPEYNVLAAALNDAFSDLGQDHPVRYWADLA